MNTQGFKEFLRRSLARFGYRIARTDPDTPPSLTALLREIEAQAPAGLHILCLATDVALQSELLRSLPVDRVTFAAPIFDPDTGAPSPGASLPTRPAGPFLVILDVAAYSLEGLIARCPWLSQASHLLLQGPLGSFWSGTLDISQLGSTAAHAGFQPIDYWVPQDLLTLRVPSTHALLICRRGGEATASQRRRLNEAIAFLSAPIARHSDFHLLAGRGSFGASCGVFNPGAIAEQSAVYLLPRTERFPWAQHKADEARFFAPNPPLLLTLDRESRVSDASPLTPENLPEPTNNRIEDFRLFRFRGDILSNHAVISLPNARPSQGAPLRLDALRTRVGLSRLDIATRRLVWLGFPLTDRPLARTEKNWAFFSDSQNLFLLYSIAPYVLLSASDWPRLQFTTRLEATCPLPFGDDDIQVRNSIDPIDYTATHWLHVVHKVYPGKRYCFWALLIAKHSLRPTHVSRRPLVRAPDSFPASILYVCSAVADATSVLLVAGIDDAATAIASISRARLDAEWLPLPA